MKVMPSPVVVMVLPMMATESVPFMRMLPFTRNPWTCTNLRPSRVICPFTVASPPADRMTMGLPAEPSRETVKAP